MENSMHILISLMAIILSSFASAEPIVVATSTIEQISKKLRENDYYIKRGPAKFKIFYFDIGKPETPIYLSNSVFKRFYRNENKCFELTIEEKINFASRLKCHKKMFPFHCQYLKYIFSSKNSANIQLENEVNVIYLKTSTI
jgi:hypothetical protein